MIRVFAELATAAVYACAAWAVWRGEPWAAWKMAALLGFAALSALCSALLPRRGGQAPARGERDS